MLTFNAVSPYVSVYRATPHFGNNRSSSYQELLDGILQGRASALYFNAGAQVIPNTAPYFSTILIRKDPDGYRIKLKDHHQTLHKSPEITYKLDNNARFQNAQLSGTFSHSLKQAYTKLSLEAGLKTLLETIANPESGFKEMQP